MKTTGEKIRERRTHLGLTQTELADKIGVTLRTITKYEKQGVMPRGRNLRELAKALGVSEIYLANDAIEDETYGLEEAPYIDSVRDTYGANGANDMQNLLMQTQAMFAGGDIPQADKDKFFQAVMAAYVATKEEASERFTNKRYKK